MSIGCARCKKETAEDRLLPIGRLGSANLGITSCLVSKCYGFVLRTKLTVNVLVLCVNAMRSPEIPIRFIALSNFWRIGRYGSKEMSDRSAPNE